MFFYNINSACYSTMAGECCNSIESGSSALPYYLSLIQIIRSEFKPIRPKPVMHIAPLKFVLVYN